MAPRVERGTAPPALPAPAYALAADALTRALATDADQGLAFGVAAERLLQHGPNQLPEAPRDPWWRRLSRQFRQPLVLLLIAAALVSALLGEWADTVAILAILGLNAVIGFLQEDRAERALEALRQVATPVARVRRDGQTRAVPAHEVVRGDLVELEAGDQVPADARLVSSHALRTQEAALTGESLPIPKDAAISLDPSTPLAERSNMVWMGTAVAAGRARAVVTATGPATELGRIAGLLERTPPRPTPLQRRLDEFGRLLAVAVLAIVVVIAILHLARGRPLLEVVMLSVSLAVAAVPEGLPAVVTLVLALGVQRMARRRALVRELPAVETLGSVTVICTDKTGTLTLNEMTVREVTAGRGRWRVTGEGYAPSGGFEPLGAEGEGPQEDLQRALTAGLRCSDAVVRQDRRGRWTLFGDPTEGALVVAALKAGLDPAPAGHHRLWEVPFESERRMMSVAVRDPAGATTVFVKGAPETVIPRCVAERVDGREVPLDDARRAELHALAGGMAGRALRVLALAARDGEGVEPEEAERGLVFAGLAGMLDPPRPAAHGAVASCRAAGIRPMMITGDHPLTALAIARELDIARPGDGAMTGHELDALDAAGLAGRVDTTAVFARVTAEHKLRVVEALHARGEVAAMTGDGVNDAPALRAADIGIAMGRTGTAVTRGASDLVLLDDDFATIVAAVEEGRTILGNIRKFVRYLLSCNLGEVMFMFFAALAGWPVPLVAIQILWINLVTDGLPALALGLEPADPAVMRRPPRPPGARLLPGREWATILARGLLVAAATGAGFLMAGGASGGDVRHARAVAFAVMAFAQMLFALAFRSERRTVPELGPFSNPSMLVAVALAALAQGLVLEAPWLRPWFQIDRPLGTDWALVGVLALAPVTAVELWKLAAAGVRRLMPARQR
jgi:Ca2+-transporting ATPase